MTLDYLRKLDAEYARFVEQMATRTLVVRANWEEFGDARKLWELVSKEVAKGGGPRLVEVPSLPLLHKKI